MDNFVVYAYVRSGPDRFGRMGTFYYIGKGKPDRPYISKGRKNAKTPKDRERIIILHSNLDEDTAFDYEKKLIKFYGRADVTDFGVLRNLTDGGEGLSGYIMKESQRKLLSELGKKLKGKNNPNYGKKLSPERRKKLSDRAKERFKVKENNPMYGKSHRPEVRKILSEKAKAITGRDHPRTKLWDWYHPVHGEEISLSIIELIEKYPGDELKYTSLCDVVKQRAVSSKGWSLLINKGQVEVTKFRSIKKLCTWFHPTYGLQKDISAPDLVRMFPDLNLNRQNLCSLSLGKLSEYRGWTFISNSDNNCPVKLTKHDWFHKDHGIVKNLSVKELLEKFSEMNLHKSKLSLVKNGKVKSHKGWTIYSEN